LIDIIVKAAESKKALDIKVMDISKSSSLVDSMVICGAESPPQLRAIEKEIDSALRKIGVNKLKWEGVISSGWVVLDLGSIVVHVLGEPERDYYRLEDLWGKEAIVYHY
jgi:ribosome-associated protein